MPLLLTEYSCTYRLALVYVFILCGWGKLYFSYHCAFTGLLTYFYSYDFVDFVKVYAHFRQPFLSPVHYVLDTADPRTALELR